jgi:hypothetical protein
MNHSERDARLARSLQMLAEVEAEIETPKRVETAVMARWDAAHAPQAGSRRGRLVRGTVTAAAGITLVGALAWQRAAHETDTAPATDDYTTVAVVGGPLMADEPIRVVRMRVARSVLGELGIPSPARQGTQVETVDIDVLVGEDGVARGVRVPVRDL